MEPILLKVLNLGSVETTQDLKNKTSKLDQPSSIIPNFSGFYKYIQPGVNLIRLEIGLSSTEKLKSQLFWF